MKEFIRSRNIALLVWVSVAAFTACGDSDNGSGGDEAAVGEACNESLSVTCTEGLVCVDNICVNGLGGVPGTRAPITCEQTACGCGNEDSCSSDELGAGTTNPFDLSENPSSGVAVAPDGALVASSSEIANNYIWIAESANGSILKVDTQNKDASGEFATVARYFTGPQRCDDYNTGGTGAKNDCGFYSFKEGTDPSRTSVDVCSQTAFVANRNGGSVTAFASQESDCVDRNENGSIETSRGPDDILAWGEDECMKWHTELPGNHSHIRAIAAQCIATIDDGRKTFVWVGDDTSKTIWKLDGVSGEILLTINDPPARPYGFAFCDQDTLWISGRHGNGSEVGLGYVETEQCTSENDCSMGRVGIRNFASYGIACDFKNRVWMGGDSGKIVRYTPGATPGSGTADMIDVGSGPVRGISTDERGFAYAARENSRMVQVLGDFSPNNTSQGVAWTPIDDTDGRGMWGSALDTTGQIWGVGIGASFGSPSNTRIVTAITMKSMSATLGDIEVTRDARSGILGPYTYSDMAGGGLGLITQDGFLRARFEKCDEDTEWDKLYWEADTPAGSQIIWTIRVADSLGELGEQSAITVGADPPNSAPIDIRSILEDENADGLYMEVEVILRPEVTGAALITPRLYHFSLSHDACGGVLE